VDFVLRRSVLAAAVAAIAVSAGAAVAVEPVDTVVSAVEKAAGVRVPRPGAEVIGGPGGGVGGVRGGRSAVVGYISVTWVETAAPSYTLLGALADPNEWSCTDNGGTTTYSVTCVPVPLVLPMAYHCDVLHADASGASEQATVHTSLDCDSDGVAEAATGTVNGVGNDRNWAVDTRLVTAFTCTVESRPNAHGGCGDPGLVGVE
jgi:hypothetical protein